MRVQGNVIPDIVHVENYGPKLGMVQVRLRENVRQVQEPECGEVFYQYDEYTFCLPQREDLEAEIRKNMEPWLETGRSLETRREASALWELRDALNAIYQGVRE